MPYTNAGKNNMLDNLGATHVAAFEGDPSGAGTELDRQAITFDAAASGSKGQTGTVDFSILSGETVDHIAYYDDPTAGNLLAYDPVTSEAFGEDGTYTLTETTLNINDA